MAFVLLQLLSAHLTEFLAVSVTILAGIWLWVQHHFNYWKRHNVPYIKANPIFGNFKELFLFEKDPCTHFESLYYHEVARDKPVVGLHAMGKHCLLIRNLDLIKAILNKDFNKFSNRFSSSDPHSDSLGSDNLFFSKNPMWRELRQKITPVFTSGKIKQMFPLIEEIGRELDTHLLNLTAKQTTVEHEIKDINALYTTDVISSVAYGITANSLNNPEAEFRKNGKRLFEFTRRRALELTSMFFFPSLVRFLGFKVFSPETTVFLRNTLNYVMEERIKSGLKRNDLIDVLVNLKAEAEADKNKKHFILQGDCLIAQAAVFFSAGFETSSSTMSFALYELAKHPELQERLRDEIRTVLEECDGKLSYDLVMEMKYLNCVLQEVLRLYPPLPFLDRECTLNAGEKGYSLKPYCDFEIPHGMPVYVPMHALHMDAQYFPNPEVFDPERFNPETNKCENNFNAYMPFGTGPHNCIGERFGLLQTKIGLINFLRNHYVSPSGKTPMKMKFNARAIIIQAEGGIHLNVTRDPLI